jgi:hypothetical protein
MPDSTFRAAVEAHDPALLAEVLHPDIVFRSPAVHAPYVGRETAMAVLGVVITVLQDFRYVDAVRDGNREVLRFAACVGEREIDGVDIVRYDAAGSVTELTVIIRPMSGLRVVADAVGDKLATSAAKRPAGS